MYDIKVNRRLPEIYPEIRLGCLQFSVSVRESSAEFWHYMNETVTPRVCASIADRQWCEIPGIRGSRTAYKTFGRNPGRYRVSSEALLRRLRWGDTLYRINSVVDVNNLFEALCAPAWKIVANSTMLCI